MKSLDKLNEKIVQWHYDRDIIANATDWKQTKKMLEEFCELVAAQMPGESPEVIFNAISDMTLELYASRKIKTVSHENAQAEMIDAIGDMDVVGVNILERNGVSKLECLNGVYEIISRRKGKNINGTFVKESAVKDKPIDKTVVILGV